ncbi:hypothetical protein OAS39_01370 [Pirellulales bacterium]|nr:hypothetical protein [Pirellulales bacterium]
MTHRTWSALVASMILLLSGCGASYKIANVSGQVVKDGKPLSGVLVSFQPTGGTLTDSPGPGSYGVTDAEGRFELKFVADDRIGAVIGSHRVVLKHQNDVGQIPLDEVRARFEDADAPAVDDRAEMAAASRVAMKSQTIPKRFRDGTLRIEVPAEGADQVSFDLTRPKRKK